MLMMLKKRQVCKCNNDEVVRKCQHHVAVDISNSERLPLRLPAHSMTYSSAAKRRTARDRHVIPIPGHNMPSQTGFKLET